MDILHEQKRVSCDEIESDPGSYHKMRDLLVLFVTSNGGRVRRALGGYEDGKKERESE